MATEIQGVCDPRFQPFKDAFAANFAEGLEVGASLAAAHHGRPVVDLWAGYDAPDRRAPWRKDTIVQVASTTKIAGLLSALILVDRGQLELDERIARYWPEFAQGGKEQVTVREALTHRAGVPSLRPPVSPATACDWGAATAAVAARPHWFGGTPRLCYHGQTYGFLIGEMIRRVDGRMPHQFFREEIAAKIGADFQVGIADSSEMARIATLAFPEGSLSPADEATEADTTAIDLTAVDLTDVLTGAFDLATWYAREDFANNGFGNGRSIARLGSIVACNGEVDGVRILSTEVLAEAAREQVYEEDVNFGTVRMGLTFGLDSKEFPAPTPTTLHWGGTGGSVICMDPKSGLSAGYAPNNWFFPEQVDDLPTSDRRVERFWTAFAEVAESL